MKLYKLIIAVLVLAFFASCSNDNDELSTKVVHFCVNAAWQNGRYGPSTRALTTTNLLDDAKSDIIIDFDDYPNQLQVKCSDGTDAFILNKRTACQNHTTFLTYASDQEYKISDIQSKNLSFTATGYIDYPEGDVVTGTATKENIEDDHLQLVLHHTKAMLRFAFKVDSRYDLIRFIKVTGISLNGSECTIVDKVLNTTTNQFIAYAYIDPKVVTTAYTNTILCTYDIYDKDADFVTIPAVDNSAHLTRKDVIAKNTFTLGSLKDATMAKVTEIKAGYYYDLKVTLNPDYLYVLSEHDNKHITIE